MMHGLPPAWHMLDVIDACRAQTEADLLPTIRRLALGNGFQVSQGQETLTLRHPRDGVTVLVSRDGRVRLVNDPTPTAGRDHGKADGD